MAQHCTKKSGDLGFIELGVSNYTVFPLVTSNNVSELICNTLALKNNGLVEKKTYKDHGFPTWVPSHDRKLLQSSTPAVNLVVAQDGSGNYKTIKGAIDAAAKRSAKRSGSERFVIRIKSGVYKVNLEIGNKMKNIMLLGDGPRTTIITGSRSVVGGSTTFNSATVDVTGEGFIGRGTSHSVTQLVHKAIKRWHSDQAPTILFPTGVASKDIKTLYVQSERQFYKEC